MRKRMWAEAGKFDAEDVFLWLDYASIPQARAAHGIFQLPPTFSNFLSNFLDFTTKSCVTGCQTAAQLKNGAHVCKNICF